MYLYYLIAIMVIVIDQFTKKLVIKHMEVFEQIPVIENFFSLTSHRNSGAAWGILAGQMGFFYIVTGIVVVGIIFYMEKYAREDKLLAISLSLILGGALGNFIDRLFYKEVVDFLDFNIFGYEFPIFNVADSSLFVGVALIIIATFIDEKKKEKL